jgi:hypothetical protein
MFGSKIKWAGDRLAYICGGMQPTSDGATSADELWAELWQKAQDATRHLPVDHSERDFELVVVGGPSGEGPRCDFYSTRSQRRSLGPETPGMVVGGVAALLWQTSALPVPRTLKEAIAVATLYATASVYVCYEITKPGASDLSEFVGGEHWPGMAFPLYRTVFTADAIQTEEVQP